MDDDDNNGFVLNDLIRIPSFLLGGYHHHRGPSGASSPTLEWMIISVCVCVYRC